MPPRFPALKVANCKHRRNETPGCAKERGRMDGHSKAVKYREITYADDSGREDDQQISTTHCGS
jgi:hypothetical protein